MKQRVWAAGLIAALLFSLAGCAGREEAPRERFHTAFLGGLDTVVQFTAYCTDSAAFDRAAELVRTELERLDGVFNIYRADSELSRVNAGAGGEGVPVSEELAGWIEECRRWQEAAPAVNIAMGRALSLWHTARESGEPPAAGEIEAALSHSSMEAVRITEKDGAPAVALDDPLLSLDMGGVAKGLAARSIAESLRESGLDCFLLDCGTSTLVCAGCPPGREGWTVALKNPDASLNLSGAADPPETLGEITVSGRCVSTSGDYQKYFEKNGTRYSHILDSGTGFPAGYVRAVTVLTEDAGAADFYSTALFAQPYASARALAEQTPGLEALWVLTDGSVQTTPGFPLEAADSSP